MDYTDVGSQHEIRNREVSPRPRLPFYVVRAANILLRRPYITHVLSLRLKATKVLKTVPPPIAHKKQPLLNIIIAVINVKQKVIMTAMLSPTSLTDASSSPTRLHPHPPPPLLPLSLSLPSPPQHLPLGWGRERARRNYLMKKRPGRKRLDLYKVRARPRIIYSYCRGTHDGKCAKRYKIATGTFVPTKYESRCQTKALKVFHRDVRFLKKYRW